jgi:hypothetical protein
MNNEGNEDRESVKISTTTKKHLVSAYASFGADSLNHGENLT